MTEIRPLLTALAVSAGLLTGELVSTRLLDGGQVSRSRGHVT